jgi:hypothetical protein
MRKIKFTSGHAEGLLSSKELTVHSGRRAYAQLMDVLPLSEFRRCVLGFPQSLYTIPGPIHGRKLRGGLHRSLALAVQRVNGERMMTR